MPSAASEKSQRAMAKRAEEDYHAERTTIQDIMSTPLGRRWAWLQLDRVAMFHDWPFGEDALTTARRVGQRSEGLYLLRAIQRHCPHHYILMTQENTRVDLGVREQEEEPDEQA